MTGRTLMGSTSGDLPFMNLMKSASGGGSADPAFTTNIDNNGYPTSEPNLNITYPTTIFPAYIGHYVLKFIGTGVIQALFNKALLMIHSGSQFVGSSGNFTVQGTNPRVEFSFNSAPPAALTMIFPGGLGLGPYANMANLVLCRAGDEAALDVAMSAGRLEDQFLPEWVSMMRELNPRVFRPMGWVEPNSGNTLANWDYRTPIDAISWNSSGRYDSRAFVGTIGGTNTYTCAASSGTPATWTHFETFQGRITNANTTTTPSIDVGGRGAKTILTTLGFAPGVGSMPANSLATFVYDAEMDRVLYSALAITGKYPLEVQLAACNKIGADFWYCFPNLVSDAFVSSAAIYTRDHLNSNRTAYFEWCNEIWNFGFVPTQLANVKGRDFFGFPDNNARPVYGTYGKRVREVMGVITAVWPPRPMSQLKRVMAFQAFGSPDGTELNRMNGNDLGAFGYNVAPNRPIDFCDVMSYATYFSGSQCRNGDGAYISALQMTDLLIAADGYASGVPSRMSAALDMVDNDLRQGTNPDSADIHPGQTLKLLRTIYAGWEPKATTHNTPVVCYEGGLEMLAPSAARLTAIGVDPAYSAKITNLMFAYKHDDRCRKLVIDQFNDLLAQPHSLVPAWLLITGPNQWSPREGDMNSAFFKTWDAMVEFNTPPHGGRNLGRF